MSFFGGLVCLFLIKSIFFFMWDGSSWGAIIPQGKNMEWNKVEKMKNWEFTDAIMLNFTSLKFNMDPFLLVASSTIVNN